MFRLPSAFIARFVCPRLFIYRPLFLYLVIYYPLLSNNSYLDGTISRLFPDAWTPYSLGRETFLTSKRSFAHFAFPPSDSKKEVFQPHLPVRLPCYDLAPVTGLALGRSFRSRTSGTPDSHGLTGGVYKARERIHRAMADARLLANPASWSRVADSSPN